MLGRVRLPSEVYINGYIIQQKAERETGGETIREGLTIQDTRGKALNARWERSFINVSFC